MSPPPQIGAKFVRVNIDGVDRIENLHKKTPDMYLIVSLPKIQITIPTLMLFFKEILAVDDWLQRFHVEL